MNANDVHQLHGTMQPRGLLVQAGLLERVFSRLEEGDLRSLFDLNVGSTSFARVGGVAKCGIRIASSYSLRFIPPLHVDMHIP